ncbi:MAG: hypothetical protein PF590_07440 [Candidatus Delongbacteria bacterium]|jgi:hypothetical protein|nr:hypothetical protein [Candidatus Delongbacteria bacterium]
MARKLTDRQKACLITLQSDDRQQIYKCIDELPELGSVALMPAIFDLYQRYEDDALRHKILTFLKDIKDKIAPAVFVNELKERTWTSGFDMMLSICWQSSLDFSPHVEDFLLWADSDDMQIQMEALTNIEQFIFNKNAEGREKIRTRLKDMALGATGKKRELIMSFLTSIQG